MLLARSRGARDNKAMQRKCEKTLIEVTLKVNGKSQQLTVEDRALLADTLRDTLDLTGTHIGCDTSQCGCCTVLLDNAAVKSCTMLTAQADGCSVTTIEGLASNGELHPVQKAFSECHALQCGFCTPGMIMATVDLLKNQKSPDARAIQHGLEGNLCRCTGYINIERAVQRAAELCAATNDSDS